MTAPKPVSNSIIVIDDEPDTLEPLRVLLSDEGFSVRVATSGDQALALIAEQRPDVLVLDVMMPSLSGTELTQRLRAHDATRGILVIAYTGYPPARLSPRGLFDRVLLKPADFPVLLHAIQTLLTERKP